MLPLYEDLSPERAITFWNDTLPSKLVISNSFASNLATLLSMVVFRDKTFTPQIENAIKTILNGVVVSRALDYYEESALADNRSSLIEYVDNIYQIDSNEFKVCHDEELKDYNDDLEINYSTKILLNRFKRWQDYDNCDRLDIFTTLFKGQDDDNYYERDNDLIMEFSIVTNSDCHTLQWSPYNPNGCDDFIWDTKDIQCLIPAVRINLSELVRLSYALPTFSSLLGNENKEDVKKAMSSLLSQINIEGTIRMDHFIQSSKFAFF